MMNENTVDARVVAGENMHATTQRLMAERGIPFDDAQGQALALHEAAHLVREAEPEVAKLATAVQLRAQGQAAGTDDAIVAKLCNVRRTLGGKPVLGGEADLIHALRDAGVGDDQIVGVALRLKATCAVVMTVTPAQVDAAMRDRAERQREHGEDRETIERRASEAARAVEQLESDFAPFLLASDRTCIDPRLHLESPAQTCARLQHETGRDYNSCSEAAMLLHVAAAPSREALR